MDGLRQSADLLTEALPSACIQQLVSLLGCGNFAAMTPSAGMRRKTVRVFVVMWYIYTYI